MDKQSNFQHLMLNHLPGAMREALEVINHPSYDHPRTPGSGYPDLLHPAVAGLPDYSLNPLQLVPLPAQAPTMGVDVTEAPMHCVDLLTEAQQRLRRSQEEELRAFGLDFQRFQFQQHQRYLMENVDAPTPMPYPPPNSRASSAQGRGSGLHFRSCRGSDDVQWYSPTPTGNAYEDSYNAMFESPPSVIYGLTSEPFYPMICPPPPSPVHAGVSQHGDKGPEFGLRKRKTADDEEEATDADAESLNSPKRTRLSADSDAKCGTSSDDERPLTPSNNWDLDGGYNGSELDAEIAQPQDDGESTNGTEDEDYQEISDYSDMDE